MKLELIVENKAELWLSKFNWNIFSLIYLESEFVILLTMTAMRFRYYFNLVCLSINCTNSNFQRPNPTDRSVQIIHFIAGWHYESTPHPVHPERGWDGVRGGLRTQGAWLWTKSLIALRVAQAKLQQPTTTIQVEDAAQNPPTVSVCLTSRN